MLRSTLSIAHAVVVLAIAAMWPVSSGAVIVTGGFTGTTFSVSDISLSGGPGFFGLGFDVNDQPITGTFRYDTAQVPPGTPLGIGTVVYADPTFSTDFLDFSITINGRTYTFGEFAALPGIQQIDVSDASNDLGFDFQRSGVGGVEESLLLRFISDIDFLSSNDVPTSFDYIGSGAGLPNSGFFSFALPNGDFAGGGFSLDTAFARIAVPEPGTLSVLALGLFGIAALRRRTRATRFAALPNG